MSATFWAWRLAPTVTIVTTPASRRRCTCSGRGAAAKLATLTPRSTISEIRSAASGWLGSRFTPNGFDVRDATLSIAAPSSSRVMVAEASIPRPPAAAVAAVRRAPETHPIPVCTSG